MARERETEQTLRWAEIEDVGAARRNLLCSLSEDELSPAAMATRALLRRVVQGLIADGSWRGVKARHLDSRSVDLGSA